MSSVSTYQTSLASVSVGQEMSGPERSEAPFPYNICLHQIFVKRVEQRPNEMAVIFEQEQLTYRELNQKANQLAHYLRKLGVRPGEPVGLCTGRSLEAIIGILGILKVGGAYANTV